MSTIKGSAASNGAQPIPTGSRKMVQSLKEIVNCPEAEIYAALKECNMDPNEAISRLLSQDTFHEVKSKRERKKEGKDTSESRSRAANISSNRGGKNVADRYPGRGSSAPYKSSDSTPSYGKPTYKKENVSSAYTSAQPSAPGITGTYRSRVIGDAANTEAKGPLPGTADGVPAGGHAPSVTHSPWGGVPGQLSMADIVKRGIQQPSKVATDRASEFHDSGVSSAQNVPVKDEWPSIEKPAALKMIPVPQPVIASEARREAHVVPLDSVHQDYETEADRNSDAEKGRETEDDDIEDSGSSLSSSARIIPDGDTRDTSVFENDHHNRGHYQPQAHEFEQPEVDEVSASVTSVSRNLQNLSVNLDDRELPAVGSAPSVVIPDHLQVQTSDFSHLSFGSFGAGLNVAYSSGTMESVPPRHDVEEPHGADNIPSVVHPDTRRSEYYVDDSLQNPSDGSLYHNAGAQSLANHDASADSHPEEMKPESATEVANENQYSFPSTNSGYSFDEAQHLNTTFNQPSSEMQNLASLSNIMQPYPNSLQSTLLAANAHPSRESELHQYSQFPTQSMSAKYGNSVSSLGGSTISMSEALKTAGYPSQPSLQALSGTSVATGPPLPQHLAAMHPYSQHTLPYANMIGYPFMPQSYTYMPPTAFQQAFAGNSSYHQSLAAALLPQYKNSISVGSLPQTASNVPSGYGATFANAPGNFTMNQPSAASGATLSYEDVLSAQYKDNSHLMSLQQQNEWLQGVNSRTMSAIPPSTYYNYSNNQGQAQQQPGGGAFRQAQAQPNYGYPNLYHTQAIDPQQPQIPRESQQQAKQMWHNGY